MLPLRAAGPGLGASGWRDLAAIYSYIRSSTPPGSLSPATLLALKQVTAEQHTQLARRMPRLSPTSAAPVRLPASPGGGSGTAGARAPPSELQRWTVEWQGVALVAFSGPSPSELLGADGREGAVRELLPITLRMISTLGWPGGTLLAEAQQAVFSLAACALQALAPHALARESPLPPPGCLTACLEAAGIGMSGMQALLQASLPGSGLGDAAGSLVGSGLPAKCTLASVRRVVRCIMNVCLFHRPSSQMCEAVQPDAALLAAAPAAAKAAMRLAGFLVQRWEAATVGLGTDVPQMLSELMRVAWELMEWARSKNTGD